MRLVSKGLLSLALLASCAAGSDEADDTVVGVGGKDDGVSQFKLTLTSSGSTLRARENSHLPGATSGSTASFACPVDDRTDGGWRLLCNRGNERLSLVYGPDEKVGAVVYLKSSLEADHRAYYRCTATTQQAGKWPGELECTAKQPRTMISGQMVSPFASTIENVGIFNAHVVAKDASTASLVRGMKPFRQADFDGLSNLDVRAVLMFKRSTSANELSQEVAALADVGIASDHVVNIAFPWKDFADFAEPCRMTVRGLKLVRGWVASGQSAFLHCTVGEDRTGYLAGLYRLLTESAEVKTIFNDELCENGYSAGNPQKPAAVVEAIDEDLTPLFLKMAFKIARGDLTKTSLDESVCDVDPENDPAFVGAQWDAASYQCKMSTRYRL
jgi:hypothetical protein